MRVQCLFEPAPPFPKMSQHDIGVANAEQQK